MKSIKFLIVFILILSACKPSKYPDLKEGLYADIQTNIGDVLVELYYKKTPMTVANFVALAEGNHPKVKLFLGDQPFYDGRKFHRVIESFMVQAGKLENSNQEEGYVFANELRSDLKHNSAGVLSMTNTGKPFTNSTQFFITHKPAPWLDGYTAKGNKRPCGKYGTACHTVFGKVLLGQPIVDSIKVDDYIKKITVIRVGGEAEDFNAPEVFEKLSEETIPFAIKKGIHDAVQTTSGLKILRLQEGKGIAVNKALPVKAHYTLYTVDGVKIYSSIDTQEPITFTINNEALIAGWKEGVGLMKEGEKSRLFIPNYLGYGSIGQEPLIKPNTDLILEIEILKVGK